MPHDIDIRIITGKYSNSSEAHQCADCEIGRYQPDSNATYCINCEIGKSSSAIGQVSCISCGDGTAIAPPILLMLCITNP
jgi:hypothetical protein